jgi:DNA-binding CsgD family transcriptional regulator
MPRSASALRAEREVVRLCHSGLDAAGIRSRVLRALRRSIPVDAAFLATADPETLLFTGAWADEPLNTATALFLDNEFGAEDVNKFTALATSTRSVASLDDATRGERHSSPRYREIMRPLGLGDELRAALVAGERCWGYLCLHREDGRTGFTSGERSALARLAPHLGHALRTAALVTGARAAVGIRPGVVLLDRGLTPVAMTAEAEDLLSMLEHDGRGPLPMPVRAVATVLAAIETGTAPHGQLPSVRVPTRSGLWLTLHAARLPSPDGGGAVTVVVAPVEPRAAVPLVLAAHGLSAREAEVATLVVRGRPTAAIAAELQLSAHTVQDHLKSVFDKVGVRSRRELVSHLLGTGPG